MAKSHPEMKDPINEKMVIHKSPQEKIKEKPIERKEAADEVEGPSIISKAENLSKKIEETVKKLDK